MNGALPDWREAVGLYQELAKRGYDGPAFRELAGKADVETLKWLVSLSAKELARAHRCAERGQWVQLSPHQANA